MKTRATPWGRSRDTVQRDSTKGRRSPPSERVTICMGRCTTKKWPISRLSAALISIRKPHGPPCRIVVNRDSSGSSVSSGFRGHIDERRRPLHGWPLTAVGDEKLGVVLDHGVLNRLDLLLRCQPFIGCSWLRRRPCLKYSRRPVHGGIFNPNSDYPNLPPLRAERIPKRPMHGSPRVEFTIRLVARINVDKGDAPPSVQPPIRNSRAIQRTESPTAILP